MAVIGVFCSSKENLDARYEEAACQVGEWIGRNGHTLLYGGSRCGLMNTVSQAVKAAGGRVFGAVPDALADRGLVSDLLDVEFRCADLSGRKEIFVREADAFIALPGGIGTLDEIFSVAAGATIGEHTKQVFLYNANNYWTPLWNILQTMRQQGFIDRQLSGCISLIQKTDELDFPY